MYICMRTHCARGVAAAVEGGMGRLPEAAGVDAGDAGGGEGEEESEGEGKNSKGSHCLCREWR